MRKNQIITLAFLTSICISNVFGNTVISIDPNFPIVNNKAYWIETSICSVVLRLPIEKNKALQTSTPIDQLSSLPAICTSNVSGQNQVVGGVRSLISAGHRITSISHQVTVLSSNPSDGKSELLISALFSLEKPQSTQPNAVIK